MEKVYIVKCWDDMESVATPLDNPSPSIFKVVDSEEKAKKITEDFPLMFYDEHEVE